MGGWKDKRVVGRATLYLGDVRDMLEAGEFARLPFASAIISDPPYSSGGYQEAGKGSGSIGTTTGARITGDTYSTRGYLRLMRGICQGFRVAEVYLFTDWRMWPNTFDAIEDGGFRVRSMIVWNKGHGGLGVKWRSQHELICWGARGNLDVGWGAGNVINCDRSGNVFHPTEKPVFVLGELVRAANRALVIDPFMGSGTTGIAAVQQGRDFIGVEIEAEHFETACKRLEEAERQGSLFEKTAPTSVQAALL
jgi:DNA modification methylase